MNVEDNLLKSIGRILEAYSFRYNYKSIRERDLLGAVKEILLIHALSSDERTVITIRVLDDGTNRMKISLRNINDKVKEKLVQLEELGFNIYDDEDEVSIISRLSNDKLASTLNTVIKLVT